jgi:trigger factor
VNVSVENLAPCKKLVRVELDAAAVEAVFDAVTKDILKQASLPGFRPGKAPRAMVIKKFASEIKDEAKRKLIGDNYRKAIDEQKLKVVGYPDIEEVQFERGQALQFTATVETAPEFELPDYKGLPVQMETKTVTDEDVTRALDLLREQHVKFEPVTRALAGGDVAVVNYTGTCDGKPINELAPTAKGLTEQKSFWVDTTEGKFIPGFAAQLIGAQAGEKRTVNVDFPADFVTPLLQGKKGVYAVELVEVREKILPPVDDELAKKFGAENLDRLKEGVRKNLEDELKYTQMNAIRNQVIHALLSRANFDLPETAVAMETRNVVYDLVQQGTQRGMGRDLIEKQKDEIYSVAANNAKDRVKLSFLIQRIAEQEKITVTQDDAVKRAQQLAAMYQMPLDQFIKDLQKRNGINELFEQALREKVLDLLAKAAAITNAAPAK